MLLINTFDMLYTESSVRHHVYVKITAEELYVKENLGHSALNYRPSYIFMEYTLTQPNLTDCKLSQFPVSIITNLTLCIFWMQV